MKKKFFIIVGLLLLSTSVFAEYLYKGSFTAGQSISGQRDSTYSYMEYDFVVEQYGLVEFMPQEPTNNSVQYKIQDYAHASTAGYFYVGGAEGITSHGSNDYPDGWKIQMMPGTYKIKVYARYDEVYSSDTTYSMNTTFTPALNQTPPTAKNIYDSSSPINLPSIILNQKYSDNIGFYRDTMGAYPFFQNNNDWFSFTLSTQSDVKIDGKFLSDLLTDNIKSAILYFEFFKLNASGEYQTSGSFNTLDGAQSNTFSLDAGSYRLKVGYSNYDYGSYEFTLIEEDTLITPVICIVNNIWEQKEKFNPNYCPTLQSDNSILIPFAPWTNGRLGDDGYYDGNQIITQSTYNLLGKNLKMKFSLNGANNYFGAFVGISDLTTGLPYQYLTTDHVWGTTKLVDDNKAIYYQMSIHNDGTYSLTISYNGYGQSDIHLDSGMLTSAQTAAATDAYIYFNNGDNYGGISASSRLYEMTLSELISKPIVSQNEVAKLYVATFNRAPDKAGLDYWINSSGLSLEEIAQSFFEQTETQELYPTNTTNRDFINSVYQNLFNREPDIAGWDYWENELNEEKYTKDLFIQTVINGAKDDDSTILANKTEVGISFADAGMNDTDDAKNIMKDVTKDYSSVTTAKGYVTTNNIPSLNLDGTCSKPTIEGVEHKYVTLESDKTDSYNIKVCGSVQVMTSDSSIVTVERYTSEYVDEITITTIGVGEAIVTVSDDAGAAYLFVTVSGSTNTSTSSSINWLVEEPDGYHSWSDANAWCQVQGGRLPLMSELIEAWNAGGGTPSPTGFEKDTFYWSSEVCTTSDNCHKACAMDWDCSTDDGGGWSDDGYGHPKCVMP